jgi:hypothetical protein
MFLHCNKPARLFAVALLLTAFAVAPVSAGPAYLQEVADMPLPAGFAEDSAAGMVFDKPEGRIVEAVARGRGDAAAVARFYRNALPELGWVAEGRPEALSWRRDGETLRLEVAGTGAQVVVRFHIAPQ